MRYLLLKALDLPQAERYRLAFLIAESMGYDLKRHSQTCVTDRLREALEEIIKEVGTSTRAAKLAREALAHE